MAKTKTPATIPVLKDFHLTVIARKPVYQAKEINGQPWERLFFRGQILNAGGVGPYLPWSNEFSVSGPDAMDAKEHILDGLAVEIEGEYNIQTRDGKGGNQLKHLVRKFTTYDPETGELIHEHVVSRPESD